MPYTPNNPLVPGDPYSYDLKWMVDRLNSIKDPEEQAALAKAYAEAAEESKDVAVEKASEAGNAKNDAETAAALASQSETVATNAATTAKSYSDNIADPVGGIVTQWLDDNVTPVGGAVTVDTGLTITGSAADSRRTGLNFRIANSFINDIRSSGAFSWGGISVTMSEEVMVFSGTSTAVQNITIYNNSAAFPIDVSAGDVLNIAFPHTNSNLAMDIFSYINGGWNYNYRYYGQYIQYPIPVGATGLLIRLYLPNGVNSAGTAACYICKTLMNAEYEQAMPVVVASEGTSESLVIERYLALYGAVYLAAGTHKCRYITMPDNSIIMGSGNASIIEQINSNDDGIRVGSNCTIKNIHIKGLANTIPAESAPTTAGISIVGNGDSAPYKYRTVIDEVKITGFYHGIKGENTGYWCANGATISNCYISTCRHGIAFINKCEYNSISNCTIYGCYAGVYNASGNNLFTGCHFTENTVGFYIPATATINDGHGSCIGCTFNHANNNTGYGVLIQELTNGFVFSGCQFWYGQIYLYNSYGVVIEGSLIGGGNNTISNWASNDGADGGVLLLANNLFNLVPTINEQAPIRMIGNYDYAGNPVTI